LILNRTAIIAGFAGREEQKRMLFVVSDLRMNFLLLLVEIRTRLYLGLLPHGGREVRVGHYFLG